MSKKTLNITSIQNELKGASVFFQRPVNTPSVPQSNKAKQGTAKPRKRKQSRSAVVRKSRPSAVSQSGRTTAHQSVSAEPPQSRSYELRKYNQYKRLDVRLPKTHHRYLSDLEDDIRDTMPEIRRDNPEHRIITKAAIVRVYIELFRQLDIAINAKRFHNELDLLDALNEGLKKRFSQPKKDGIR